MEDGASLLANAEAHREPPNVGFDFGQNRNRAARRWSVMLGVYRVYSSPKNRRLIVSLIGTSGPMPKRSGMRVPSWAINGNALARRASASGPVSKNILLSQSSSV